MKIEVENGEKHIYLEEGDKVFVSTLGSNEKTEIARANDTLHFAIPESMISNIKQIDKGTISRNEIRRLCDEWLLAFIEMLSLFKDKASTKQERRRVRLVLGRYRNASLLEINYSNAIELYLESDDPNVPTIAGPYLKIDAENEEIFKYLFAEVMFNYIGYNYEKAPVDEDLFKRSRTLWSKEQSLNLLPAEEYPIYADLFCIDMFGKEYVEILQKLIQIHNQNVDSNLNKTGPVIRPLEDAIKPQVIKNHCLQDSVIRTKNNYNLFLKLEEEQEESKHK